MLRRVRNRQRYYYYYYMEVTSLTGVGSVLEALTAGWPRWPGTTITYYPL